ncbi:MAG: alkaline phosphatase family protein [Deltaproteobacteria bacterium]|nr:alkaline phosphatase family protein [Deltaproteobacteria bacterium]
MSAPRVRWLVALGFIAVAGGAARACSSEPRTQRPPRDGGAGSESGRKKPRVVILGFDGMDPRWVDQWIAELPNIEKLGKRGSRRPLRSTEPPQSPVAWTSFATGSEPAAHGIYDFIRRDPATYRPFVGTTKVEVPRVGPPVARNLRSGEPFWQRLGNNGVRVVALNVPYSFPPDRMDTGRMLSGLGVPDLRGTNSTFTVFAENLSTEERAHAPAGGIFVPIDGGAAAIEGPLRPGPVAVGEPTRITVPVRFATTGDGADCRVEATAGGKRALARVGAWTDWLELSFSEGGRRARGMVRLLPLSCAPLRVFMTPVNLHPRAPYLPISEPGAFVAELADDYGLFKTIGWDHDTSALNAEVIDDDTFLADVRATEDKRLEMTLGAIRRGDFDLLISVWTGTDRVAHMFYRLIDPEHPRHDAAAARRLGNPILDRYRAMDDVVGKVARALGPDDLLIVMSDHGFQSYRRGLHVNSWLRERGYLVLREGAPSPPREFLLDVDWARTRAYALGTGQVYVNVRGRERDGIVAPGAEYDALVAELEAGLEAITDAEAGGVRVVRRAYTRAEAFRGGEEDVAPDLQLAFADGYRTSWESILGGMPEGLFAPNRKKWSGDHSASDVDQTPGLIVSSRRLGRQDPAIVDFARTVLGLYGVEPAAGTAGRSFLE